MAKILQKTKKDLIAFMIFKYGSQKKLAKEIGVTQQTVSRWIAGLSNISAKNALIIEKLSNRKIKRWQLSPHVFEPPQ